MSASDWHNNSIVLVLLLMCDGVVITEYNHLCQLVMLIGSLEEGVNQPQS